MPPKGAKAVFPAGRGKPIRTSTTTRLGAPAEVKRGLAEKMNGKVKIASLDRFLEKRNQEGAQGETRTVASLDISEQPGFIRTGLEPHLQEGLEGSSGWISDNTSQLNNPHNTLPQIYHTTENHTDLMNSRRADKVLTQPENVQQRPSDGNGGSLAMDLAILDNVGISSYGKVDASRPATTHDKDLVQTDNFFSLPDHSSWSSNE
ncbi:hypothetical protein NDU88_008833 [Pleurodeles waltl]|uniref:Uncharacterized protein n=1 Tax=Pleurodeles waltl TaxID=8319 RepID=A0AAV7RZA1_PLEWA|nr:hypothetical protein NDU88_008833 [Pleurodeles waltl]